MRLKRRIGPNDKPSPRREGPWTRSLHVWVVASFAVAQPLCDLPGKQAEFFVFQNAGRAEVLGLVVVLSGLVPLVLVAAVRLAGLIGPRTGHRVHHTILAVGGVDPISRTPTHCAEEVYAMAKTHPPYTPGY